MNFRLFGVNVHVLPWFWVMTAVLGFSDLTHGQLRRLLIWVAIVFISVLVHEYGHAFAVKRHGIEPAIILNGMGGLTTYVPLRPLSRFDSVIISLAGPFAGFLLAAPVLAFRMKYAAVYLALPAMAMEVVDNLLWVNIGWGLVNLLPVLPFDGGRVLEHTLGPQRVRLSAGISMVLGGVIAAFFLAKGYQWGAMIFAFGTLTSYQRFASAAGESRFVTPRTSTPPSSRKNPGDDLPPELDALLRSARHAVANDQLDRAIELAQRVLGGDGGTVSVPPRAAFEALEVIAWAHLLADRIPLSAEALTQARKIAQPDAALAGALLMAQGALAKAREVFEGAMARHDDRKEVAGPLIQILIEQNETAKAATVALQIQDSLSGDDLRKMAQIAYEKRAFDGAARLYEAVFNRHKKPEDAYEAARALAQDGQVERALDSLRRAVETGFTDRARAWSDTALEGARATSAFEALLPRP